MSRVRNATLAPVISIVLALAGAAPVAHAAEDGGTRSPFAVGAGTRALALGGAFCALADDAEALEWNPAGLALAARTSFEATHASEFELGTHDDNAVLVMPSWRWGVAAFSARSVGVGGIQPRDDRNQVTGGDLTDSQTEFTFGYARPWGDAFRVGGALKLQRQSLAGFGATGLGADLGAQGSLAALFGARLPALRELRVGFAIRNAIEPALRLDRESVNDPRVWRGGLAWSAAPGGRHPLNVALDLEHSAGLALRPHVGLEWAPLAMMALRVGVDRGQLAAGTSFRWHELDLSYAYEDQPLGTTHRFGLSHAFGPSVDERRASAERAERARLDARLELAFQQRNAERMNHLLAGAADAMRAGSYDAALEQLAVATTLDSADARPRALEVQCQRELGATLETRREFAGAAAAYARALELAPDDSAAAAGARRSRLSTEGLAARDAERRERFRSALDALVAGDLGRARAGFAALAQEDPRDPEARAMVTRADEAIARRVVELTAEARQQLAAQAPDEALRRVRLARELDPRAGGLDALQQAANRVLAGRVPVAAPAAPVPVTPAQQREAARMVERGVAAMAAGRPDEALHYWELAWSLDPGNGEAASDLNREYLARGMDAYAAGRLDDAVGFWEKAQHAMPTDARAASFLARARERAERTREIFGVGPDPGR